MKELLQRAWRWMADNEKHVFAGSESAWKQMTLIAADLRAAIEGPGEWEEADELTLAQAEVLSPISLLAELDRMEAGNGDDAPGGYCGVQVADFKRRYRKAIARNDGVAASVEVDRDTDGELLIDWAPGPGRMVTLSLRADGRLSYAFTWDGEKSHGTAQMPSGVQASRGPLPVEQLHAMRSEARASDECEREHWFILFARAIERAHGVQASPAPSLRLLTDGEVGYCECNTLEATAREVQREFCKVNGLPAPASGVLVPHHETFSQETPAK